MLKDQDIICIASANWDAVNWVNVQHIMARLARENTVFYVDSLGLRAPTAARQDVTRVFRRLFNFIGGVRAVRDNVWVFSPIIIPIHSSPLARRINSWIVRAFVRLYQKRLGLTNPILWIFLPTAADLIGHVNEKLVIYHCVDEYSANPGVPTRAIKEMEKQVLAKADVVFTTSVNLYEDKRRYNPNTVYVPNVANSEHFAKARDENTRVARIFDNMPKPRIGFIGNLASYKVDFDLLGYIARQRPQWQLVLVGPVGIGDTGTSLESLRLLPNVHIAGEATYGALPNICRGLDVCIIPFVVNETTNSSFPMKFYEYMAAGKPIVSTDLPALAHYQNHARLCRLAPDRETMVAYIEQALNEPVDEETAALRAKVADENSWKRRIEDLSAIIEREMEGIRNAA